MVTILNVSKYARSCEYIVARCVDGNWWFYDAWNDAEGAYAQAGEIGGQVFLNKENFLDI